MSPGLRYRVEYGFYFLLTRGLQWVPHSWASRLGTGLGILGAALPTPRRHLVADNLERSFPEKSLAERERILRRCYRHWGRMFLESVSLARYDKPKLVSLFDFVGLEHLEAAMARGNGVFVSSGHFGAFEISTYGIGLAISKLHILVRRQSNPWVDRDNARLRQRTGHELIPRQRSGHRMLNILRRGEVVGLAIDQRVRNNEGVLIPFLGRPGWTSIVPATLTTLTGAAVVHMTALPLPGGRYEVRFKPPHWANGRGDDAVFAMTSRMSADIESDVYEQPELWFWMHTRWTRCQRRRWASSIDRLREESGLPERAGPDGAGSPELAAAVNEEFLEEGQGIVVTETHTLRRELGALGHDLIDRGYGVLLVRARNLADRLERARADGRTAAELRALDLHDLVIIEDPLDDIGPIRALLEQRRGRRATVLVSRPGAAGAVEDFTVLDRRRPTPGDSPDTS